MDEQVTQPQWVWQGFFGPLAAVTEAKAAMEAMLGGDRVGAVVPPAGSTPEPVDVEGDLYMIAVQVRPSDKLDTPAGCRAARPDIVGRLVGA